MSTEKMQAVEKQNDLILKKIISVNKRSNKTIQRSHSQSSTPAPQTQNLKTHNNLINLKREIAHIQVQNQRLAEKLLKSKSSLEQTKMNQKFYEHLKRRQMISKYEFDEGDGQVKMKKARTIEKLFKINSSGQKLAPLDLGGSLGRNEMGNNRNISRITEHEQENEEV